MVFTVFCAHPTPTEAWKAQKTKLPQNSSANALKDRKSYFRSFCAIAEEIYLFAEKIGRPDFPANSKFLGKFGFLGNF